MFTSQQTADNRQQELVTRAAENNALHWSVIASGSLWQRGYPTTSKNASARSETSNYSAIVMVSFGAAVLSLLLVQILATGEEWMPKPETWMGQVVESAAERVLSNWQPVPQFELIRLQAWLDFLGEEAAIIKESCNTTTENAR